MTEASQNIVVFVIAGLAIAFLVRKFIWKPNKKTAKSCGNDGCGC